MTIITNATSTGMKSSLPRLATDAMSTSVPGTKCTRDVEYIAVTLKPLIHHRYTEIPER